MKLIVCNGRILEVYDVGKVMYRLECGPYPIKAHGTRLMSDDEARELLKDLKQVGHIKT